jgi:hypothetical protein
MRVMGDRMFCKGTERWSSGVPHVFHGMRGEVQSTIPLEIARLFGAQSYGAREYTCMSWNKSGSEDLEFECMVERTWRKLRLQLQVV